MPTPCGAGAEVTATTPPLASPHPHHLPTLLGASFTLIGALLAVVVVVFAALLGASVAHLGT